MYRGIFAPVPTPFAGESVAWDKFALNAAKWGETPLAGLVVGGSNGEFVLLERQEKAELVRVARSTLPSSQLVIAGTSEESTLGTIRLTRACAEAGADAALVLNPYYYKDTYTDAALKHYFLSVAEASPIPVLLYNMPKNTGLSLSVKLVCELSKHPNIVGLKDSSGNIVQIAEIIANTPPEFVTLAGSGSFLLAALAVGARGGTMALAVVLPHACVRLLDLFNAGKLDEARTLQHKLLAPNHAVTTRFGAAGLKAAIELFGFYGGAPRPPLLPLTPAEREQIAAVFASFTSAQAADDARAQGGEHGGGNREDN
ncbi:MAG: 4-hydroxy-tetrahydrodipicolinate synthase [Firmicutes bacterium]|nr:4-hydroxy-tetrahydrodipicolinate synthase [candidate division NPL-UPA2 bacterium]